MKSKEVQWQKRIKSTENKSRERVSHGFWPLWEGGVLLLVAILFVRNNGTAGGTPSIAVYQDKIDYGYVKFGETRQFAIQVTNTGDGLLRFKEQPYIEVLEGC